MIFLLIAEVASESPGTMPGWVDELIVLAIQILTPIILLLVGWLTLKWGRKLGVENAYALAKIAMANARRAINYADRWAKRQDHDEIPPGDKKLEKALEYLIELEAHAKIGEKLKESLSKRLHTELEAEEKESASSET